MNEKLFLITGQLSLVMGITGFVCNYFYWGTNAAVAFVVAVLFGLSLVMNLAFLVKWRNRSLNNRCEK